MKIVEFDDAVCIALSDKSDGNMKNPDLENWVDDEIIRNRQRFLAQSGINIEKVALVKADYSRKDYCRYQIIEKADGYRLDLPVASISVADGLATKTPGIGIFLPVADCLVVVIYGKRLLHRGI